jgi:hypothetical protein
VVGRVTPCAPLPNPPSGAQGTARPYQIESELSVYQIEHEFNVVSCVFGVHAHV